jgi:hypothetical protein
MTSIYFIYVSVHPCCSTEIRNFNGSDSDRRMFLISVEQLWIYINNLCPALFGLIIIMSICGSLKYYEKKKSTMNGI